MADPLNALFAALAPLWEMSLTGAFAAGVVLLLRLALKNRAPRQAVCLLWLIVFARLLIPFSLQSPLSAVPQVLTDAPAATQQLPAEEDGPASATQPGAAEGETPAGPGTVTGPAPAGTDSPAAPTAPVIQNPGQPVQVPGGAAAPFPWRALAAGVWLAGALTMAGYALISYLVLRRRLFDAVRVEPGVWEHPDLASPFLLGVFRPRIYLPAHLPTKTRFFVLAHERAHLRRFDHIVKPICYLALALHWFNPAAWIAFLLLSRDLEGACDQSVLRALGSQVKADYSAALLSVAAGKRFPAPCPLAFGRNDARGRIQNVLHYRKPALWVLIVAAIAVAAAAVALLTDPVADSPDPEPTDSAASPSPEPGVTLPDGAQLLFENTEDGLAVYRQSSSPYNSYLVSGGTVQELPEPVGETVTGLRLADLDGDGADELAITGSVYAGAGGQGVFTLLEAADGGWDVDNMAQLSAFPELEALLDGAAFTYEAGDPNVTISISPLTVPSRTFTVSQEAAEISGTYLLTESGGVSSLLWWQGTPYLRLTRSLELAADPGGEAAYYPTGVSVEVLARLSYAADGSFSQRPVALYPACDGLSTLPSQFNGGAAVEITEFGVTYYEDALTLLALLPDTGAFLYATPDGQTILRSGADIGPLPEEIYPDSQSGFSISLTPLGASPGRPVLTFSSVLAGFHNTAALTWSQEAGTWTVASYTQDELDLTTPATGDTFPEDPTRYYLVTSLPEENIRLYARNQGAETVVVWENFYRSVNRRLHVMPYTPPLLNYTGGTPAELGDLWVIAQQSLSARGDDIQELVVYRLDFEVFGQDYAYDWRTCEEAADFFANHTLTYHADGNTFTLTYDGQDYPTGQMSDPRGDIVLEEGRTTALSPDTAFVNYAFNEDGSAAVTLQARPLDEEVDGEFFWYPFYEVSWDITFADGQFHTVPGTFTVSPLY